MHVLDGKPYLLPDGTWGAAIGEVYGPTKPPRPPAAGDLVWLYTKTAGIWQARILEVLEHRQYRWHAGVFICRTEIVRKSN